MVFGTFDILHPGHINFFKQARKHGDYLIAVIARDKTVLKIKGKSPRNSEKTRLAEVLKNEFVNKAVLGGLKNKYAIIKKYQPDIICLGYDQKYFAEQLDQELKKLKLNTKIIRLKPFKPEKYKTSILKNL